MLVIIMQYGLTGLGLVVVDRRDFLLPVDRSADNQKNQHKQAAYGYIFYSHDSLSPVETLKYIRRFSMLALSIIPFGQTTESMTWRVEMMSVIL